MTRWTKAFEFQGLSGLVSLQPWREVHQAVAKLEAQVLNKTVGHKLRDGPTSLVRAVMREDAKQARAAAKVLTEAELVAVALPCLCEFVWALRTGYSLQNKDIASAVRALLEASNVQVIRLAVEAGLSMLEGNGDFANGVIADEGHWLGGETFVSFDKRAVQLLTANGQPARLL